MISERDLIIADLEAQLKGGEARMSDPQPEAFIPSSNDDVDQMLHEFIRQSGCDVPIRKIGGGYYIFGTKKIYAKIMNGKLVIRVGGGYMVIEEFIEMYGEQERTKIDQIKAAGGDPFAVDEKGSPKRFSRSPTGSESKRSPKAIKKPQF